MLVIATLGLKRFFCEFFLCFFFFHGLVNSYESAFENIPKNKSSEIVNSYPPMKLVRRESVRVFLGWMRFHRSQKA